ncbi:hypothetical protein XM25_00665 [Devosia sp. H5989]|nr:hypothetical protein XM25_00665 [Devosia sp. H5989]
MWVLIVFLALWAAAFSLLAIIGAAVPTTDQAPRASLIEALVISGGVAGIAALALAGAVSLFQ